MSDQALALRCPLLNLPSEILIPILARANPDDVIRFSMCSKATTSFVEQEGEAIARLTAIRRGWTRTCTDQTTGLDPRQLDPQQGLPRQYMACTDQMSEG